MSNCQENLLLYELPYFIITLSLKLLSNKCKVCKLSINLIHCSPLTPHYYINSPLHPRQYANKCTFVLKTAIIKRSNNKNVSCFIMIIFISLTDIRTITVEDEDKELDGN